MLKPSLVLGVVLAVACGGPKPPPAAPVSATPPPGSETEAPPAVTEPPEAPLPPIPATPAPAPLELIATASAPAPASLVPLLAAYVDRVQPGMGAEVTLDALVAALAEEDLQLRGVDLNRPVRVLLLDPVRFPDPLVMVVAATDEATIAARAKAQGFRYQLHGGLAAVGSEKALIEAGRYALTTLASSPVPASPTVDIDVGYLMLHYGAVLEGFIDSAADGEPPERRELVRGTLNGIAKMLGQVERAQLSAEIAGERATGTLRLQAKAGTGLATFLAAQTPATFEQLERVRPGIMVLGGKIDVGTLMFDFASAIEPMMARWYGGGAPKMIEVWRGWMALKMGELGASIELVGGRQAMQMLFAISDGKRAAKLWADTSTLMRDASGAVVVTKTATSTHRGTKLLTMTMAAGKGATAEERALLERGGVPEAQTFGVVGNTGVMVTGSDPLPHARALIDVLKGGARAKPSVSTGLQPVLAEARRRRESALIAFDLPAFPALAMRSPDPVPVQLLELTSLGLGASGGALTLRVTVPASQVAQMMTSQRTSTAAGFEPALKELDLAADRMCACKDLQCAEKVMQQLASIPEPTGKPSQDQMDRAMASAERMATCNAALNGVPQQP